MTLYPTTLLNKFISSVLLQIFWDVLHRRALDNRDRYTFLTHLDAFLFIALFPWLKTPIQCWPEVARAETSLSCFWCQRKTFWFSPLSVVFIVGLYQVEEFPFYSWFMEYFYYGRALDFVKCFFCLYWKNPVVLSFILSIWCIMLIGCHMLDQPWIPGVNPTWSWYIIP